MNMSNTMIGNIYLLLSLLATATGQVVLKKLYAGVPANVPLVDTLRIILFTSRVWLGLSAGALIVTGFIFWLLCLHKLPLSYAYPIACSSALFVALLCVLFLNEAVTWRLWLGTLLIVLGSALVVQK